MVESSKEQLERKISFRPAWDRRHPKPNKNGGVHGVDMVWAVKGKRGAVSWVTFTSWHLPHVRDEYRHNPNMINSAALSAPSGADLGYHSYVQLGEHDYESRDFCEFLDGKCKCFSSGSGLAAEDILDVLIIEGSEAVWKRLEDDYEKTFYKETA